MDFIYKYICMVIYLVQKRICFKKHIWFPIHFFYLYRPNWDGTFWIRMNNFGLLSNIWRRLNFFIALTYAIAQNSTKELSCLSHFHFFLPFLWILFLHECIIPFRGHTLPFLSVLTWRLLKSTELLNYLVKRKYPNWKSSSFCS